VLHKVKKLIIGGGAVSEALEDALQSVSTEAYSTYGMTETISHIAMRRLNGDQRSKYYNALPKVSFSKDERGCLVIQAEAISEEKVVTNDIVNLTSETTFEWLGRFDNVINSGGVNEGCNLKVDMVKTIQRLNLILLLLQPVELPFRRASPPSLSTYISRP